MEQCRDERERRLMEYQAALEEERRKILMFQRELPLSLQLVTQAIENIRQQTNGRVSEMPVLEEFIPLKPSCSSSMEGDEEDEESRRGFEELEEEEKPDWLRSVQLWNQNSEPIVDEASPGKPIAVDARRMGGAFLPFDREKYVVGMPPPPPVEKSTTAETNSKGSVSSEVERKEKEGNSHNQRKTRRCWSPELHRRFVHALQQLGGSHASTPKQIRELMNVDGLTNDEVKSHLQKYRLHTRRPAPVVQSSNRSSPQTQFLLVGGILVQQPEYTATGARASSSASVMASRSIYAPLATLPVESRLVKNKNPPQRSPTSSLNSSEEGSRADNDDGATNPASPSTSSSLKTTTASPLK